MVTHHIAHPVEEGVSFPAGPIFLCGEPAAIGALERPSKEDCSVTIQSVQTLRNHKDPSSSAKFYSLAFSTRAGSQIYEADTMQYHPFPGSKDIEVKIQEKPKKVLAKNEENHVETNGQDDQNSHHSSGDLLKTNGAVISDKGSPGPLWTAVLSTQNAA